MGRGGEGRGGEGRGREERGGVGRGGVGRGGEGKRGEGRGGEGRGGEGRGGEGKRGEGRGGEGRGGKGRGGDGEGRGEEGRGGEGRRQGGEGRGGEETGRGGREERLIGKKDRINKAKIKRMGQDINVQCPWCVLEANHTPITTGCFENTWATCTLSHRWHRGTQNGNDQHSPHSGPTSSALAASPVQVETRVWWNTISDTAEE